MLTYVASAALALPFTAPSEASRWTPEGAPHPQTPNDARVQAVHAARRHYEGTPPGEGSERPARAANGALGVRMAKAEDGRIGGGRREQRRRRQKDKYKIDKLISAHIFPKRLQLNPFPASTFYVLRIATTYVRMYTKIEPIW